MLYQWHFPTKVLGSTVKRKFGNGSRRSVRPTLELEYRISYQGFLMKTYYLLALGCVLWISKNSAGGPSLGFWWSHCSSCGFIKVSASVSTGSVSTVFRTGEVSTVWPWSMWTVCVIAVVGDEAGFISTDERFELSSLVLQLRLAFNAWLQFVSKGALVELLHDTYVVSVLL